MEIMFEFKKDLTSNEILIKLTSEELDGKLEAFIVDEIVTKLSDKFILDYGERILNDIDIDELKKCVNQKVVTRLSDEAIK